MTDSLVYVGGGALLNSDCEQLGHDHSGWALKRKLHWKLGMWLTRDEET